MSRIEYNLVIEIDLIGARTSARLGHGLHRVIPARTLLEAIPIGCPAEVRRINIGGQALFEAVELIRAAKMHLAAQNGPITGVAQIVRERRYLSGELRGVVVRADCGGQAAGEPRKSRWRTQRVVAIERIE